MRSTPQSLIATAPRPWAASVGAADHRRLFRPHPKRAPIMAAGGKGYAAVRAGGGTRCRPRIVRVLIVGQGQQQHRRRWQCRQHEYGRNGRDWRLVRCGRHWRHWRLRGLRWLVGDKRQWRHEWLRRLRRYRRLQRRRGSDCLRSHVDGARLRRCGRNVCLPQSPVQVHAGSLDLLAVPGHRSSNGGLLRKYDERLHLL
jgi:hypothetical protein